MNELNILRGLMANQEAGTALGTVTEVIAKGRLVVRINESTYRKVYGEAGLGERVLLRNDQVLRSVPQGAEKTVYIV